MKIRKLIIYGFGRHEDRTIELDSGLTVFYGENEAGKTTIQQFIIQTLFGYPVRGGTQLRYEPKAGGKFGGQLLIEDEEFGQVSIERVSGKSAGDVTLYFEDGSRGGETELRTLLRGLDRTSFESVFAFSVHQLQGLERMTEEELSRTLLASGTTGVDTALQLRSKLEKEMAELFKRNGRNPQMNQVIEELRETEAELKAMRRQMEAYEPARRQIREFDSLLGGLEEEEQKIGAAVKEITKWLQAVPLLSEKERLTEEIGTLSVEFFPADGLRRMERLTERLGELESRHETICQTIAGLQKQRETLPPDPESLRKLISKEPEWHRLRAAQNQKQEELLQLTDDKNSLLRLLGMDEEALMTCDSSLQREEELLELLQEAEAEEEERRFLDRQLKLEKTRLAELEAELDRLMREEPSVSDREKAETWRRDSAKLAEAKAAQQISSAGSSRTGSYVLVAAGAVSGLAGILEGSWMLAAAALIMAATGVFLILRNPQSQLSEDYTALLQKYGGKEAELEELAEQVRIHDRESRALEQACAAQAEKVEALIGQEQADSAVRRYQEWLTDSGFPADLNRQTAQTFFEKVREAQLTAARLQRAKAEQERIGAAVSEQLSEAEAAAGIAASAEDFYAVLRSELSRREEQLADWRKAVDEATAAEAEMHSLQNLIAKMKTETQELLQEAGAKNIEQYYRLHEELQKKEQLKHRLKLVTEQLESLGAVSQPEGMVPDEAETFLAGCEEQLETLRKERNRLLAERAEKRQFINRLLTDESYAEKRQEFEEKKARLAALARRWSIDRAAAEAIRQTMEELKENRLPAVLEKAGELFGKLTLGEYEILALNPDGIFEVRRKDGLRFRIAELSQATKEQAYLALRLALAVSMKTEQPFPFIMDDPFVHFDRRRMQQMVNLMNEMKGEHQFIYFTCHSPSGSLLSEARIVGVASDERSVTS